MTDIERLVAELASKDQDPLVLALAPATVLRLVALLHLAQRHPRLAADLTGAAQILIQAIDLYFEDCPIVLEIMHAADKPVTH